MPLLHRSMIPLLHANNHASTHSQQPRPGSPMEPRLRGLDAVPLHQRPPALLVQALRGAVVPKAHGIQDGHKSLQGGGGRLESAPVNRAKSASMHDVRPAWQGGSMDGATRGRLGHECRAMPGQLADAELPDALHHTWSRQAGGSRSAPGRSGATPWSAPGTRGCSGARRGTAGGRGGGLGKLSLLPGVMGVACQ